jgi:TPR repeat protein
MAKRFGLVGVGLSLFLMGSATPVWADAASDAAACDALAASKLDVTKPVDVEGIAYDDVDVEKAIKTCNIALRTNPDSARIKFQLARAFDKGKLQLSLAAKLYQQAAEKGSVVATFNLGRFYDFGMGVKLDENKAGTLYCKAAESGLAFADYDCGRAYYNGFGVTKDFNKALQFYQKAADAGNSNALVYLGYAFENASGVPKDMVKANAYYQKAVDFGNPAGMNNLGSNLVLGAGITQDVPRGIAMLHQSINLGDVAGPVSLAEAYDRGKEIPYDANFAAHFYLLSITRNSDYGKEILIQKQGAGIKPTTIDAIQNRLIAEGRKFKLSPGKFTPEMLEVLTRYAAGK